MIKLKIDKDILLNINDLGFENYRSMVEKFTFRVYGYKDAVEIINLAERIKLDDEKYLKLPCNLTLVETALQELNLEYEIEDTRALPFQDELKSSIQLRDNQKVVQESLEKVNYNALITAKTGYGKTVSALYFTEHLNTNMLFVASRRSLLDNLLKDAEKFGIDTTLITEINTEWLKNPIITPIMYCTTQTLNEKILAALYGNVGLLVADEVHLGITGEKTRNNLFGINPKYRLYLSATPENKIAGFVHACLSVNEVTSDENIPYTIQVTTLKVKTPHEWFWDYKNFDAFNDKKSYIYNTRLCPDSLVFTITERAFREGRGIMIYADSIDLQERLARKLTSLRDRDIKVGILNTNTSKQETKEIIEGFDDKKFDVIIGSSALTAGLSFERLSLVIDTSLRINSNNLTQLLGRLKRKNDKVCNKSKEFIKISYDKISHSQWESVKKESFSSVSYVKFSNIELDTPSFLEINNLTSNSFYDATDFRALEIITDLIKFGE